MCSELLRNPQNIQHFISTIDSLDFTSYHKQPQCTLVFHSKVPISKSMRWWNEATTLSQLSKASNYCTSFVCQSDQTSKPLNEG